MPTAKFTMRLDPALKAWLDDEGKRQDRSAAYIAQKAIAEMMEVTQSHRLAIDAANAEADKGAFISQEAMYAWMDTWDTDAETPPPQPDIFLKRG
jgi:predicted transcriptional regulator